MPTPESSELYVNTTLHSIESLVHSFRNLGIVDPDVPDDFHPGFLILRSSFNSESRPAPPGVYQLDPSRTFHDLRFETVFADGCLPQIGIHRKKLLPLLQPHVEPYRDVPQKTWIVIRPVRHPASREAVLIPVLSASAAPFMDHNQGLIETFFFCDEAITRYLELATKGQLCIISRQGVDDNRWMGTVEKEEQDEQEDEEKEDSDDESLDGYSVGKSLISSGWMPPKREDPTVVWDLSVKAFGPDRGVAWDC
ncbi:hypothetical protein C8J56DRAFT_889790 [Mycena floridula]|nr:hypothetical protein C8J56DRAFT_889790 [Mycena floridula]